MRLSVGVHGDARRALVSALKGPEGIDDVVTHQRTKKFNDGRVGDQLRDSAALPLWRRF